MISGCRDILEEVVHVSFPFDVEVVCIIPTLSSYKKTINHVLLDLDNIVQITYSLYLKEIIFFSSNPKKLVYDFPLSISTRYV